MIDYAILNDHGTTQQALREFFTAPLPLSPKQREGMSPERIAEYEAQLNDRSELRQKFQSEIQSKIGEAMRFGLEQYAFYSAVDYAWDSRPLQKHVIPLLAYAEGRITFESCRKQLNELPTGKKFLKVDKDNKPTIDLPTFFEMNINLVRSVINRRKATQCNRYNNLWPFFKYEARSTGMVGRLRGDATSQRMDIMADQFDYRNHHEQTIRSMMLYPFSVSFVRSKWEREVQYVRDDRAMELDDPKAEKTPCKAHVVREGVYFNRPHPSRVYADNAYPMSSINTDTGCEFIGYWDVTRSGEIRNNHNFFNRDQIASGQSRALFTTYADYFNQYYDKISVPTEKLDPVSDNDRVANVGLHSASDDEMAVFITHHFQKIVPKDWGIGTYPYPVWLHLQVAGDDTVVFADILPSRPAAYFGWNNHDVRLLSPSMAHELMQFQDQLTNLFTKLLKLIQQDMFKMMILNRDIFPDGEKGERAFKELKSMMECESWYAKPTLIEASFRKLRDMGIDITPDNIFKVVGMPPNDKITEVLNAIMQIVAMADRLHSMTSQEQGQPSPSGISATETSFLAGAKENIDEDFSNSIDQGRAAMKVICYEAWQACGVDDVKLPVTGRYPKRIVELAKLQVVMDDEEAPGSGSEPTYGAVAGKKSALVHDYIFTSRDGTDRVNNVAAANAIVSALQAVNNAPEPVVKAVLAKMGASKYFSLLNTIFRLSTGEDLGLEVAPGEDDSFSMGPDAEAKVEELTQVLQRVVSTVQQQGETIKQIMQAIGGQAAA